MFLKSILVLVALVVIMFCFDIIWPKIIKEYKRYCELKKLKKKRKNFKRKMKELEIK
jgi:DNA-binding helix-hairpin-helix protein with protein kinase domain